MEELIIELKQTAQSVDPKGTRTVDTLLTAISQMLQGFNNNNILQLPQTIKRSKTAQIKAKFEVRTNQIIITLL